MTERHKRRKKNSARDFFDTGVSVETMDEIQQISDPEERELTILHLAFSHGNLPALYEALHCCVRWENVQVPLWVLRAAMGVFEALVNDNFPKARGRSGNPIAQFRNDMTKYRRWDEVEDVRRWQREYRDILKSLPPERRERFRQSWINPGRTLDEACKITQDALKGTPAFGSVATIKNSYKEVRRAMKDPGPEMRFKFHSRRTMRLMGFQNWGDSTRLDRKSKELPGLF